MIGVVLMAYVQCQRVPMLKPGDVLMMDNLSSPSMQQCRHRIESVGAKLRMLPQFSPGLNPIEKAFSKSKTKLRAAQKRTISESEKFLVEVLV